MTNRKIGDYGVETDFYVAYVPQARELLNGNLIIDSFRGPVYQIFLGAAGFIFKDDYFTAGKFLNVASAGITLFFAGKIFNSLFNKEVAFFAVLLISVNSIFWRYTYQPGTDMLFLLFYSASLFFILKNEKLGNKNLLTAGILTALAYLTRYTGISLIVLAILIFLFQIYKKFKIPSFKKHLFVKPMICYFTPLIILISVWGIISYQKTGEFFYNKNFQNTVYTLYKPNDVPKDEWNFKHQHDFKSMTDVVFKDFGVFTKTIFKNFTTYFAKDIFRFFPRYMGIFVVFGLLVFILEYKKVSLPEKYYCLASMIFYLQILLIFYSERFSLPLLPFYAYLIVRLFSFNVLQRFNLKLSRFRIFGVILFSLVILNFYNSYVIAKEEINRGPVEILTIKEWIDKNYEEELNGKSLMARKPHIAYYLNMNLVVMPYAGNYEEFINNVKINNVDFVFVSEKEGSIISNENLKQNLFNLETTPKELEIITGTKNPLTILYKVKR